MIYHKKQYKTPMIRAHNIGFNILSSILRFNKSIIENIVAPPKAIKIIFEVVKIGSNSHKATKLTTKEAQNPALYPTIVLFEDFGKKRFPNLNPKTDAAPSPIVAIKAAEINTPKGKNKTGTKDKTKAAGLIKLKISVPFIALPNKFNTLSGNK